MLGGEEFYQLHVPGFEQELGEVVALAVSAGGAVSVSQSDVLGAVSHQGTALASGSTSASESVGAATGSGTTAVGVAADGRPDVVVAPLVVPVVDVRRVEDDP